MTGAGYAAPVDEFDLLAGVLDKTGDLIAGVADDQWALPTSCPQYDVRALTNHLVAWVRAFDAGRRGEVSDEDPARYVAGDDPAGEFRAAAASLVAGWREHGIDAPVQVRGPARPGPSVFDITVMEFATHGWDLAVATGQAVPLSEEESRDVLARARRTLAPRARGEGMPFAHAVEVGEDAPATDQLVAFLGRRPCGAATGARPAVRRTRTSGARRPRSPWPPAPGPGAGPRRA